MKFSGCRGWARGLGTHVRAAYRSTSFNAELGSPMVRSVAGREGSVGAARSKKKTNVSWGWMENICKRLERKADQGSTLYLASLEIILCLTVMFRNVEFAFAHLDE